MTGGHWSSAVTYSMILAIVRMDFVLFVCVYILCRHYLWCCIMC